MWGIFWWHVSSSESKSSSTGTPTNRASDACYVTDEEINILEHLHSRKGFDLDLIAITTREGIPFPPSSFFLDGGASVEKSVDLMWGVEFLEALCPYPFIGDERGCLSGCSRRR
ncbi:hypothetical protein OPV22_034073 [Ensete ventricosum]|uniref:Uncharacterized protein n=1 Tax=Ensete ventricosum TaxID=4639 RepID=A0AAV8PRH2_ENSVE|nr:hypothetical protein OPV22_034073 [Ensete ventricosum]